MRFRFTITEAGTTRNLPPAEYVAMPVPEMDSIDKLLADYPGMMDDTELFEWERRLSSYRGGLPDALLEVPATHRTTEEEK